MSETLTLDVSEKDKIFVVQENPYFVAVVYPKENRDVKTRPGVIVQTVRMTKKRCRTCKGRDNCFHLGVFKKIWSRTDINWKLWKWSHRNFVFLKKPNARIYKCVDSGSKSRIYKSVDSAGLISFAQNQQYVLRWPNQGGWRGINATTNNNNRLFQCWSLFDHKNMVLRLLQM